MFQSLGPKLKKVRGRASREKQIAMMPEDISVSSWDQSLYRTGEEPEQCYADSGQMEKNLYADTTWEPTKARRLKFRKKEADLFRMFGDGLAMPRDIQRRLG
jgi:hypothetical protein